MDGLWPHRAVVQASRALRQGRSCGRHRGRDGKLRQGSRIVAADFVLRRAGLLWHGDHAGRLPDAGHPARSDHAHRPHQYRLVADLGAGDGQCDLRDHADRGRPLDRQARFCEGELPHSLCAAVRAARLLPVRWTVAEPASRRGDGQLGLSVQAARLAAGAVHHWRHPRKDCRRLAAKGPRHFRRRFLPAADFADPDRADRGEHRLLHVAAAAAEQSLRPESRVRPAMLEGRILVSGIMVIVFATAVGLSFTYAPETRMLPLVIGIPGLTLSIVQLFNELRARPEPAVTPEQHKREGRMFAWFLAFIGGLVLFGFLYMGPLLVAAYLYFSGKERWYVALIAAAFAFTVLYGIFEQFLGLPLFEGLIVQWIFG